MKGYPNADPICRDANVARWAAARRLAEEWKRLGGHIADCETHRRYEEYFSLMADQRKILIKWRWAYKAAEAGEISADF